jgi:hypothetical protein
VLELRPHTLEPVGDDSVVVERQRGTILGLFSHLQVEVLHRPEMRLVRIRAGLGFRLQLTENERCSGATRRRGIVMKSHDLPCDKSNPFIAGQSQDARYVESIMEHAFLSDLLQHCWFVHRERVEVIRPDVDDGGYDLVLEANKRIRHVQVKSRSKRGSSRVGTTINSRLQDHPDPCVISISWDVDAETCRVNLKYRYSESKTWPPKGSAPTFELKGQHFRRNKLDTPLLVEQLFDLSPPLPGSDLPARNDK